MYAPAAQPGPVYPSSCHRAALHNPCLQRSAPRRLNCVRRPGTIRIHVQYYIVFSIHYRTHSHYTVTMLHVPPPFRSERVTRPREFSRSTRYRSTGTCIPYMTKSLQMDRVGRLVPTGTVAERVCNKSRYGGTYTGIEYLTY